MVARDVAARMADALSACEAGRREQARSLAHDAARTARTAQEAVMAARVLFVAGDVDAALDLLDRREGPAVRAAGTPRRVAYRLILGRVQEALAVLRAEKSTGAHVQIAETLLGSGDPHAADYFAAAVEASPRSARLRVALADALARVDRREAATDALRRAIELTGDDPTFLEAGARIALDVGAYDDAASYARRLLEAGDDVGHDVLGQLALFRGDAAAAAAHADAMLANGDTPAGLTIRGAARALLNRDDEAIADLEAALQLDPDAIVARVWRGELALRQHRYEEARAEVDRTGGRGGLSSWMVRALAEAAMSSGHPQSAADFQAMWGEVWEAVRTLHAGFTPPEDADAARPEAATGRALDAMRGNRTTCPSHVTAGELRRLHVRPGARVASRRLLDLVRTTPVSEILARFEDLVAEYPETGLPRAHRAELHSWLGDYGAARADFDGVIGAFPQTRWAYIGLAAVESIEGEPARALDTLALGIARMRNTIGPAVYGVRGEALRRLGRLEDAVRDLDTAVDLAPQRLSAWINLALACRALGQTTRADEIAARVRAFGCALLHDAARSIGVWLEDVAEPWLLFERALDLMLGNRASSLVTWRLNGSPIRTLSGTASAERDLAALRHHELSGVRHALARTRAVGARQTA